MGVTSGRLIHNYQFRKNLTSCAEMEILEQVRVFFVIIQTKTTLFVYSVLSLSVENQAIVRRRGN